MWIKPTSFNDPDSKWNNEHLAYDGNLTWGADCPITVARTWSSYAEFNVDSTPCDSIRFYARYSAADINQISVDVFYSGSWHNIFTGAFATQTWVEKAIGSTQDVTAVRVRFYAKKAGTANLYEIEFNEIDSGLISGYFMQAAIKEEKFGYRMNSIEESGYFMNPLI